MNFIYKDLLTKFFIILICFISLIKDIKAEENSFIYDINTQGNNQREKFLKNLIIDNFGWERSGRFSIFHSKTNYKPALAELKKHVNENDISYLVNLSKKENKNFPLQQTIITVLPELGKNGRIALYEILFKNQHVDHYVNLYVEYLKSTNSEWVKFALEDEEIVKAYAFHNARKIRHGFPLAGKSLGNQHFMKILQFPENNLNRLCFNVSDYFSPIACYNLLDPILDEERSRRQKCQINKSNQIDTFCDQLPSINPEREKLNKRISQLANLELSYSPELKSIIQKFEQINPVNSSDNTVRNLCKLLPSAKKIIYPECQ